MKYFVFGTLTDNDILASLIGRIPNKYAAILKGYCVYSGDASSLSNEMKSDIGSKRDLSNFSFLFAKKSSADDIISGDVVEITEDEEKYFDKWERYPNWYQKEKVIVSDLLGKEHEVYLYVQNIEGKPVKVFERIQGDKKSYVEAAKRLHEKLEC